ncbi:hypothetical protein NQ318_015408 [Aromia moschata]|uniref:Tc1-like transposase DDE domain-containing protein n=1 Tax=Aromia moschata TaxID=1265417 RepID=A0AAV8YPC0_9CUCU|nr:hypothetical protein NQ318_015408 [Aromia moschata]
MLYMTLYKRELRRLSTQLNALKTIVHNVLKEQLLYPPYNLQKVHELIPGDFPRRMQFANWLLDQQRNNVNFISNILFTEEASFTKNGITNLHNAHVWADEKPHATVVSHYQHQFQSINVWAGIIGNFLIGPFILPERLNGQLYLEFLQNDFPNFIEDLPLETRRNMYFIHDGAPAHYSHSILNYLSHDPYFTPLAIILHSSITSLHHEFKVTIADRLLSDGRYYQIQLELVPVGAHQVGRIICALINRRSIKLVKRNQIVYIHHFVLCGEVVNLLLHLHDVLHPALEPVDQH